VVVVVAVVVVAAALLRIQELDFESTKLRYSKELSAAVR